MRINNKYKLRKIAGESVVIMQGAYGVDLTKIISFNETSEWLWNELTDKEFTQNEVEALLMSKYEVEETMAKKDASAWVEKLLKYNLIEQ